jgi:hypothetical protein
MITAIPSCEYDPRRMLWVVAASVPPFEITLPATHYASWMSCDLAMLTDDAEVVAKEVAASLTRNLEKKILKHIRDRLALCQSNGYIIRGEPPVPASDTGVPTVPVQ